jgi:hypothetical protein
MSLNNVDDLLIKVQNNEPVEPVSIETKAESMPEDTTSDAIDAEPDELLTHLEKFRKDKEEFLAKQGEETPQEDKADDLSTQDKTDDNSRAEETDEYGNKVPKSKVYTEEEVQAMIRKRLKLHHEERQAPPPPQYQPQQQQYQPQEEISHDQSAELPWEVQLEGHIKQTVQKLETEKAQHAWQAEQQRVQQEFEHKFTSGMSKYSDFNEVVAGKPITNGIMMAARSMADPAAFIYAAAKQQPKELERIASISDPYVQAAEVGRLEERMKKARTISKAPKPPTQTRGDMADKGSTKASLDDLIRHDAKRKLGRR